MVLNSCTSLTSVSCFNHSTIKERSADTSGVWITGHILLLSQPLEMVCAVQVLSCLMKSIFSVRTLCLGSQTRLTPMGSPLSATPGASVPAYIPAVSQGGDMAQSHFQWKTTASGCRRCQMHAGEGGMKVGSNSCIG